MIFRLKIISLVIILLFIVTYTSSFFKRDYREIILNEYESIEDVQLNSFALGRIRDNYDFINEESAKFDISPLVVIGIIAAEQSLHNNPANYFEEYYIKNYFLNKSEDYLINLIQATQNGLSSKRMKGESERDFSWRLRHGLIWSVGLCQLSIIKAYELEVALSNGKEKKANSIKKIIRNLLNDEKNIEYCIYELSRIKSEVFSRTGIYIGDNIEILATLYNTGNVNQFIDRVIVSDCAYQPKPNKFGQFISLNLEKILCNVQLSNQ